MFTGIIENLGHIKDIQIQSGLKKIFIKTSLFNEIDISDSISVNGVCLTVVNIDKDILEFDVVEETLSISNIGYLQIDDKVNIERCSKIGDRLNGHNVTGHIEGIGKILNKTSIDSQTDFIIKINQKLMKYCIYKGSICIDGISLTISSIDNETISVSIIPYTLENTTLGLKNIDDYVNIETDIFAKYAEKMILGEKNEIE